MHSNGCIIEGTNIAVDFWKPTRDQNAYLYFLTHLHADHIVGLTSKWNKKIYTTATNSSLLQHMKNVSKEYIIELEVGSPHVIPMNPQEQIFVEVTFIDANHIPGAVMILFQGYFGNFLYSGDMRYYPELLNNPFITNIVSQNVLDVLYLDNTFCHPQWTFPTMSEATDIVFKIINDYPDHKVMIGVRNLGKEELLIKLAKTYKVKICVSPQKHGILRAMNIGRYFTEDPSKTFIHAVDMKSITNRSMTTWNMEQPTIGLKLTALFYGCQNNVYSKYNKMFTVPYSNHSSWTELNIMVKELKPRSIRPIVTKSLKKVLGSKYDALNQDICGDMSVFDKYLDQSAPISFTTPSSILETMSNFIPTGMKVTKKLIKRKKQIAVSALGIQYDSEIATSSIKKRKLQHSSEEIQPKRIENDLSIKNKSKKQTESICKTSVSKKQKIEDTRQNNNLTCSPSNGGNTESISIKEKKKGPSQNCELDNENAQINLIEIKKQSQNDNLISIKPTVISKQINYIKRNSKKTTHNVNNEIKCSEDRKLPNQKYDHDYSKSNNENILLNIAKIEALNQKDNLTPSESQNGNPYKRNAEMKAQNENYNLTTSKSSNENALTNSDEIKVTSIKNKWRPGESTIVREMKSLYQNDNLNNSKSNNGNTLCNITEMNALNQIDNPTLRKSNSENDLINHDEMKALPQNDNLTPSKSNNENALSNMIEINEPNQIDNPIPSKSNSENDLISNDEMKALAQNDNLIPSKSNNENVLSNMIEMNEPNQIDNPIPSKSNSENAQFNITEMNALPQNDNLTPCKLNNENVLTRPNIIEMETLNQNKVIYKQSIYGSDTDFNVEFSQNQTVLEFSTNDCFVNVSESSYINDLMTDISINTTKVHKQLEETDNITDNCILHDTIRNIIETGYKLLNVV